jgi:hypothetical protein
MSKMGSGERLFSGAKGPQDPEVWMKGSNEPDMPDKPGEQTGSVEKQESLTEGFSKITRGAALATDETHKLVDYRGGLRAESQGSGETEEASPAIKGEQAKATLSRHKV